VTDGEKWYDEHLAPKLLELAKDAHEHGLSFLAVVEWEPGETGRTAWMQEAHGLPFRMANWAAQCNGNVDAFWIAVQRYARKYGHGSVFLTQQGIPCTPNAEAHASATKETIA
jgi:hypothetical protein